MMDRPAAKARAPEPGASHEDAADDRGLLAMLREVGLDRKAELVDGEVHVMSPTDDTAGRCAENVYLSLRAHESAGSGRARGDNHTFLVALPGRRSFSPDASFSRGPSAGRGAVRGAPDFAVEVRSAGDYGARMEEKLARKRADYFAAGTQVVWDVDPDGVDTIRVYRAARPDTPDVYRRGATAEAEPAVPGWRFPVDELFR
jgi:Uma2 family endonuclease